MAEVAQLPRLRLRGLRGTRAGPFDLSLGPGECLAVTGPSGTGKSLMLRMIADLDPHEGEAVLDGVPCAAMSAPAWRRRVVYAAAEGGWWEEGVGAHFARPPVAEAAALGLPADVFGRAVALCSTGERQRLALLRTLALDPPVLLLDEPTGALDPEAVAAAEVLLRARMAAGTTLVLVTRRAELRGGRLSPLPHGQADAP